MNSDSSSGQSDVRQAAGFSALRWERSVAEQFLGWRTTTGRALERMRTFAEAIARTLHQDGRQFTESGELATKLKPVLTSCDHLTFDNGAEALAYAGLHLLDRYGRVNQVLEYLIRIGRLPLRSPRSACIGGRRRSSSRVVRRARFLCSAFALARLGRRQVWATSHFRYSRPWASLGHVPSPFVREPNGRPRWHLGRWLFGVHTQHHDFKGFDVKQRHHHSVGHSAARIANEFDVADEPISDATARQMAYEQGVRDPSAYDTVFLCNFLTQPSMLVTFEREFRSLAFSLTPGGLLIILGATGNSYPELYSKVKAIAASANLLDVSPLDVLAANADSGARALVAGHVRDNVKWAVANCPTEVRSGVLSELPEDIVDDAVRFCLPKFRTLVFVRQGPLHGRKHRNKRRRDGHGDEVPTES